MSTPAQAIIQEFVGRRRRYLGFLKILCRDTQMAEELLQELAVAVMESAPRFDPAGDLDAWVRGIARNLYRRALQRVGREVPAGDAELVETIAATYETAVRRRAAPDSSQPEQLRECLEKLPDKHRTYLHDRYERNLNSRQMAQTHGTTVNAIDTLLCRIRSALLDCMRRAQEVSA